MDLNKPGFFHFDADLIEGKVPHDKITYWYKKLKQQLTICPSRCPELGAIENTIGVFTYALQGKEKAIDYFQSLLAKPGRSKVNTLADMIFILKDDPVRAAKLTTELVSIQNDDSLEVTRAMCERGHFCGLYVLEDVYNTESTKVAAELLKQGIEKGKKQGMGQNEVCIWQFYLFEATKDIYINQTIGGNEMKDFDRTMSTFLEFYHAADEALNYYKSLALVEIAVLFSLDREHIKEEQDFHNICQEEETLKEIWEDVTSACEKAMALSPNDYRIYFKVATVYTKLQKFEEAQKYVEKSLELKSDLNLIVMNCQMILYIRRGFKTSTVDKNERVALEWYLKAYEYGKEIENVNKYASTATLMEMNYVCNNLAVDRHTNSWSVQPEKEHYLDEAIKYGERAVSSIKYIQNAKVFAILGASYAFKKNYVKAADCLGLAVDVDRPGKTDNLLKHLKYLSNTYHQYRQQETVRKIAAAFEKAWLTHPTDAVVGVFVKYGNNYVALKNRLVKNVLEQLSMASTNHASDILEKFCTVIIGNPCKAPWLKDICQQYLQDVCVM